MKAPENRQLAAQLIATAQRAGRIEMEIYRQDFKIETKLDDSPVTLADRLAEDIILQDLAKIAPPIPVIAEEAAAKGDIPQINELFFLVDPLDGTKEFIKGSNEFTVNIALIEHGIPVFGLVYAPALGDLYLTLERNAAIVAKLDPFGNGVSLDDLDMKQISTRPPRDTGLDVVASKSHMTDETRDFIETFKVADLQSAGSSLKFCLLARGDADLYPRFGPTMEWDTAAGHALLLAAGGQVLTTEQTPLTYGNSNQNYLNPFFIAYGQRLLEDNPEADRLSRS